MLAAVFLWSSATPASKYVLEEMPAAEFVVLRLSLAAVALWLVVLAMRPDARLRVVGWRPLVMGLLEPGLVTFLVSLGLTMTSPVSASVFWGVTPLIMPLLGRIVLGEPIEPIVLGAAVVAFGGIAVLAWGQTHHGGGSLMGDALVAGGIMASVLNGLIARRNAQAGASPLVTASWQLTTACCISALLLAVLPAQGPALSGVGSTTLGVLLYLGLVVSAGVYILSNYAVRHLPVARMSLLGCVTAPLGAALSALFLGIEISALDIAAIALVIGAVALPTFLKFRSPAAVEPKR
ncbi:MAG: DMT family transporter [Hyphomicrobiaceae bacterium]|jgi:drug/metabolite transporter (DMT)-like permease